MDAEFLALRRSKAFLLQHLTAYALLLLPIYATVFDDGAAGCLQQKTAALAALRMVLIPLVRRFFSFFPTTCFVRPRR